MAVIFEPSAYKHFTEDQLDENTIRQTMRQPVWIALVNPNDATLKPPVTDIQPKTALMICKRHIGALDNDLIEILIHPDGRDMRVFHIEHLGPRWRSYWERWS